MSWIGAMATSRVLGGLLEMPEGATLATLEKVDAPRAIPSGDADEDAGADSEDDGPVTPRRNRRKDKATYSEPILARNIFDSSGLASSGEDGPQDGDRKSDLKVVLLATMVAEPAEYSSALIAEEGGDKARGYGIGDVLMGEATVVKIEQKKVHVRRTDGSVEFITIDDATPVAKRPGATVVGGRKGKPEDDGGVTKEGENKYIIEQEVIDKLLENPEQLYSQVRAVPHKGPDGQVDGYRLSGIRRNSFFNKLGIKNGDIVHAANGKELSSMSSAMDAYNSLQSEKTFNFEITRRTKRQTFEYEVR